MSGETRLLANDVARSNGLEQAAISVSPADLNNALCAVLDKLNRGVLIIDRSANVQIRNTAAIRIVGSTKFFRISKQRFFFRSPEHQRKLEAFLADAAEDRAVMFRLEGSPACASCRVLVSGLADERQSGLAPTLFMILIYETGAGRSIPEQVLRQLYQLTPAEAGLVTRLFQGEGVEHAASSLSITVGTARSHLKHVFTKCGVKSQRELMQLLSLGPRTL